MISLPDSTHILVADDDGALRAFMSLLLRKAGCRVSAEESGAATLARVKADPPDLVLLDHYLPDMTGDDVLASLQQDPRTAAVPVVMLTIDGSKARQRASMKQGADDFLVKPVDPDELIETIAAQLRKHAWRAVANLETAIAPDAGAIEGDEVRRLDYGVRVLQRAIEQLAEKQQALDAARETVTASVALQVAQQTDALRKANQALEEFNRAVAHDLRSPLRSILGYSKVLFDECGQTLDRDARDLLVRIMQSGTRMSAFLDAMLAMASTRSAEPVRREVDLSALAAEIGRELQAQSPTTRLEIQPGINAVADPVLLRSVIENLLSNAFKYASKAAAPQVWFGCNATATPPVFWMRDNGIGLDMSEAPKLFQPFTRLAGATHYPGTGVGLATARGVVELHGGRIWVESSPGAGATFFFTLQA
ncbi:MAG: response regulator [Burkholderiales bacterium]|nr:response regulator [Burkholderiales bacterium]